MTGAPHQSVLLAEVVEALRPAPGQKVIDGTFGAGGYTKAILAAGGNVIAIDRDPSAIAAGQPLAAASDGKLKFIGAEGECLPGERMKIGNTNSRLRFGLEPAAFMNAYCAEGPTHHCALGVGHVLGKLKKVSWLTGLELKIIGE